MDENTDETGSTGVLERLKARVRNPSERMGRRLLLAATIFVGSIVTLMVIDAIRASRAGILPPGPVVETRQPYADGRR